MTGLRSADKTILRPFRALVKATKFKLHLPSWSRNENDKPL